MTREAALKFEFDEYEDGGIMFSFVSEKINKIFDEHEAQVNHLELELMKKSNECDALQNAVDSLEAQLKDKDERIKELDCRAYHAEGYISDLHNEYPKHKKFLDTKARSIVAMLFWEWRKAERLRKTYQDHVTAREERRFYAEQYFRKAYKKLKETK